MDDNFPPNGYRPISDNGHDFDRTARTEQCAPTDSGTFPCKKSLDLEFELDLDDKFVFCENSVIIAKEKIFALNKPLNTEQSLHYAIAGIDNLKETLKSEGRKETAKSLQVFRDSIIHIVENSLNFKPLPKNPEIVWDDKKVEPNNIHDPMSFLHYYYSDHIKDGTLYLKELKKIDSELATDIQKHPSYIPSRNTSDTEESTFPGKALAAARLEGLIGKTPLDKKDNPLNTLYMLMDRALSANTKLEAQKRN